MKQYTIQDFESFEVINGRKQCPSGDYTQIKKFPMGCSFGKRCSFGKECSFGEQCSFGEWCSFGERCSFGEWCSFGEQCSFGEWCSFGKRCSFGEWCSFGELCSFGERCSFGEQCSFGEECRIESTYTLIEFYKIDRIGSRKSSTYFWVTTDGIIVRCGCYLGTIEEFEDTVKKTHANNYKYLNEYIGAINYIKTITEVQE